MVIRKNKIYFRFMITSLTVLVAPSFLSLALNSVQTASASTPKPSPTATMDPNMSGMDHSEATTDGDHNKATTEGDHNKATTEGDHSETTTEGDHGETALTQRPLKATIGVFGFATLSVLLGATLLRHKDRALAAAKKAARVESSAKK